MVALIIEKRPLQHFSKSLVGLKHLQLIQKDIENLDTHKKQTKLRYLNQSYLFHLVALWEVFIEDQVFYTFKKMMQLSQPDKSQSALRKNMEKSIQKYHSPNRKNIDKIFKEILGIEQISNAWTWKNMSTEEARESLDKIINTRHEIAHKSWTKNANLSFDENFRYMKHLFNLATIIDYVANKHLATISGQQIQTPLVLPYLND